ncbi:hypothetical protein FRB95_007953 [Tulasnella sp. JGI-2019a]|nr:hypothetical protein FRB93_008559 [Tulasnella sp. JGI-2019a]KAG9027270.1 hypothetical protein FRB95_007953 [Tulasnella sp. JGI-2019a]
MSSILPGVTQVDRFDEEEDEYEYEYETSYATLDLRNIDQNILLNSSTFKLIGLDTPTPYLQLPGMTMRGEHDTLIGSEMIFSDGRDPTDRSRRFVVPLGTTSTRTTFKPVELRQKVVVPKLGAAPEVMDEPPPVLFQGRKQAGKPVPKEKFLEPSDRGRGQRGRPRGRGRGSNTEMPRSAPKRKGKGKQRENDEDGEKRDEDAYSDDGDDREVGGHAMVPDEDQEETVRERPRRAAAAAASRARQLNDYTELGLDLGLLGGLDAMEMDDLEHT